MIKNSKETQSKKCIKCNSEAKNKKFDYSLCDICYNFAPDREEEFMNYIKEKVDGNTLETFRKYKSVFGKQKFGMIEKAKKGKVMSRAPFGYQIIENKLVKAPNAQVVENIFLDFQNNKTSLNKLAKKYGFSVNGIKKILRNFTYLGKIKFDGEIHEGSHEPLISSTVFNHVQDKLERLGIKK